MNQSFKNMLLIAAVVGLTSCEYQRNNRIEQADFQGCSKKIYGISRDSVAFQTKLKYAEKPENEQRANAIRAKWATHQ